MHLEVALLPGQTAGYAGGVCIVVDVLRASSTIVTILERGAAEILPARDIPSALALKERFPDHTLCGERGGKPPPAFDYGNSPNEFSTLDLIGKSIILATSNGTRILATAAETYDLVLVGALLNRTAVARGALRVAKEQDTDIIISCSAAHGGSTFVLEDALGAGAIADAASLAEPRLQLTDAARFARDAFRQVSSGVAAAVAASHHAQELVSEGLGEDVGYCAKVDSSDVVPVLNRKGDLSTITDLFGSQSHDA